jgi:hypothetical protein
MIQRTFVLKKDLFTVPKGTIFHTTYPDKYHPKIEVFPYFTDEEHINGKYYVYKFSLEEVEKSPEWFEEVTEYRTFVKELRGSYKFKIPSYMNCQNQAQDMTVKKDGVIVGHVTNFDLETGEATIQILPENAESIWKEIAGPYIGVSSRQSPSDEKIDEILHDYFDVNHVVPTSESFIPNPYDDEDAEEFFNSPSEQKREKEFAEEDDDDLEDFFDLDFNFDEKDNPKIPISDDEFDKVLEDFKKNNNHEDDDDLNFELK